jgi:two-component system, chemotaxis family, response regulator Rcp1
VGWVTSVLLPFVNRLPLTARVGTVPASILLVEDEDAHAALVQAVFEDLETTVLLFRVADVDQALSFLSHSAPYEFVPEPALVLLDLNLPRRFGYDLLEAIRANPLWKHIPVVIFSTADGHRDRERSLALGASGHIGKPLTLEGYQSVLRQVVDMIPSGWESPAN